MSNAPDDNKTSIETTAEDLTLTEKFVRFYRRYYADEIAQLAQHYPNEERTLEIDHGDLLRAYKGVAEDWVKKPDEIREYAEEALRQYDLPADVSFGRAHVRLIGLPDHYTHYPGHFSPTEVHEKWPYVGIEGEIVAASDVHPKITEAAFECRRCGTMTYIPQSKGGFQEPHECQGCERQGPFRINFDQSAFIDAQKLRVSEPPEVAGGEGQTIDAYVEDDLAGVATTGDRVTVNGKLCFEQRTNGNQKKSTFESYLEGHSIEVQESDKTEMDISQEDRERIRELAAGEEGEPLTVAAESIAPGIFGDQYDLIKRAIVLSVVSGTWSTGPDGSTERGSINVLLVGDPSTGKSDLIKQAANNAPKSVAVSGKGARTAGITASAVRDDFSDGDWTLKAGAFVKANGGIVRIDELDDMPEEVRSAMLEPMANGEIHVSKADINAEMQTRVGVVAAANPKYGRFDPYENVTDQIELGSTLVSRFDLAYTVTSDYDSEEIQTVARDIIGRREHAKRSEVAPGTIDEDEEERYDPPVESELLQKWFALANNQPKPLIEDEDLIDDVAGEFADFMTANLGDEDAPLPATWRDLEARLRLAEAAAKLELSETIEKRHFREALSLTMQSMRDFGMNEQGEFDSNIRESGMSKPQSEQIKTLESVAEELQATVDEGGVPVDEILDALEAEGIENGLDLIEQAKRKGWMYPPAEDELRWAGRTEA